MRSFLMAASLFCVASLASAQGSAGITGFANNLNTLRGECVKMAFDLSRAVSLAETKAQSESHLRRLRSRQEVEIYAIGHGSRSTSDYQLQRMRGDSEADANDRQLISQQRDEGVAAVASCVQDAIEKGKALFSDVKRNKKVSNAATDLMTPWLVNTQSISFYAPEGSKESRNDWEKAKAAAELAGL